MKTKLVVFLLAAGLLVAMSTSMFAHHSNAISDKDRLVTMTGTVTKFAFINPHVGITFDAKDEHGNVVSWFTAGGSPMALHRDAGWTNKQFKLGEQILEARERSLAGTAQDVHAARVEHGEIKGREEPLVRIRDERIGAFTASENVS